MTTKHSIFAVFAMATLTTACQSPMNSTDVQQQASTNVLQQGKDYLVATSRPNDVHVLDMETNQVVNRCELPGRFGTNIMALSESAKIAYILSDGTSKIYGLNLESCDIVFTGNLSIGNVRGKTLTSLAVSEDGKEVYSIVHRGRLLKDEYQALPHQLMVFNTDDGLDAKPVRQFDMPPLLNVMEAADDGSLYVVGADMYKVDPKTGEHSVVAKVRNWDRPLYSQPDALGPHSDNGGARVLTSMYTAMKFKDESFDMATAEPVWGMTRVDLATGKVTQQDFAPFEVVMLNAVSPAQDPDVLYTAFTQLNKYDLKTNTLLKRVDLDHTYYSMVISPDGKKLYIGGGSYDITVYDSESFEITATIEFDGDMSMSNMRVLSL